MLQYLNILKHCGTKFLIKDFRIPSIFDARQTEVGQLIYDANIFSFCLFCLALNLYNAGRFTKTTLARQLLTRSNFNVNLIKACLISQETGIKVQFVINFVKLINNS